ncbi:hypothetical protein LIER_34533 [Lithospermum erythrorhizon]|uniref:Uncharacterized protein n=1 Tax=Lithospermum erythrorhizon TaxID=34254 RepID=A0AAV3S2M2_LITER
MQSAKEAAANVAASAKSGMDKTKAVMQEKVEKMSSHDETQKQMATEKKEERIRDAEFQKQQAQEQNAASKQAGNMGGTHSYSTTGATRQSTGGNQMSALPGHGTGAPTGQVVEGTATTHPIGTATGTGARTTTAHNTHVGGGANQGYGTGGQYTG